MKTKYLCPHCRASLNVGRNILFRFISIKQVVGILILDPRLGSYVYLNPPDVIFEESEKIKFICPVCCQFLKAKGKHDDMVEMVMINRTGNEYHVYFSSRAGRHRRWYAFKKTSGYDKVSCQHDFII